ncbi:hypothetical protein Nepgr_013001 [Nepenthes gracilis]|uniref:DUF3741 domain-containing protein n=1 Tax=Nepenthes gracilis TaxID=150966 RepID=A0AAD3XNY5_NEPGR|nr:hypothetical protein Nepgr_013001 [Nepenthes gracilis]
MEFTPSSSLSSSSSSTIFTGKQCNNRSTVSSCFPGVLRWIFCSGSHPTYPSDQIKEGDPLEIDKLPWLETEDMECSATSNIVARLMGLDSTPEIDSGRPQRIPDSITRSKSMNSTDWEEETEKVEGQHRRTKTSFSFRETPAYLEIEGDDFYVISFDKGVELGSKDARFEMGSKEHKQRRRAEKQRLRQRKEREDFGNGGVCSKQNERISLKFPENNSQKIDGKFILQSPSQCISCTKDSSRPIINRHEAASAETGVRKKTKKEKVVAGRKVETESDSENSSPASVLDHGEFISDPEVTSSEEDSRLRGSNSRRKWRSEILSNEFPSDYAASSPTGHDLEPSANEGQHLGGSQKKEYHRLHNRLHIHHHQVDMSSKMRRLAETEVLNSDWMYRRRRKNMKESGDVEEALGFQIFDMLINEVIHQLVEFPNQKFEL